MRHLRRKHGRPRLRALRWVETPPGVQPQHGGFEVRVPLGDQARRVQALIDTVSHSRAKFCWVSENQSQLAWHTRGTSTSRGRGSLVVVGIDEQPGVDASCVPAELGTPAPDHLLS